MAFWGLKNLTGSTVRLAMKQITGKRYTILCIKSSKFPCLKRTPVPKRDRKKIHESLMHVKL